MNYKMYAEGILKGSDGKILYLGDVLFDDSDNVTEDELKEFAETMRKVVKDAFREGTNAHLRFGSSIINVEAFALIKINLVNLDDLTE